MPYVRRSTRKTATRRYRTRKTSGARRGTRRYARRSNPSRSLRTRWENPLAKSKNLIFKYNDDNFQIALAVGGGYQSSYIFRANSLFDPDFTGAGVQPYGYDQMCALYAGYIVYASKIKIYFTADKTCKAFLMPTTVSALTYHEASDLRMVPYCRSTVYEPGGGATRHNSLKHYANTKMMWPALSKDDADFYSGTGANPAAPWYWTIWFDGLSAAVQPVDVGIKFDCKITYYCKMVALNDINES